MGSQLERRLGRVDVYGIVVVRAVVAFVAVGYGVGGYAEGEKRVEECD